MEKEIYGVFRHFMELSNLMENNVRFTTKIIQNYVITRCATIYISGKMGTYGPAS